VRLQQKQTDTEQLGINPDEIIEEEEKRQLFSYCCIIVVSLLQDECMLVGKIVTRLFCLL
jgi:hypothetical protein